MSFLFSSLGDIPKSGVLQPGEQSPSKLAFCEREIPRLAGGNRGPRDNAGGEFSPNLAPTQLLGSGSDPLPNF